MITDKKLDFWIKNNYNVILRGRHGVGKTACIKEAFERNKLKWMYFSASTMDPWVDFIGVPRERIDEKGNSYLDLVRPKAFANDEVEALFFDEYNRSASKIRNAVMELIQFKSINGKKFNNLKIVWAAINPEEKNEDDNDALEYDVEPIDPAQLDRFHVIADVPYVLDKAYFNRKYGSRAANAVYDWWTDLDNKTKNKVSPRRVDYAMDFFVNKGDLRDVLPKEANIQKLINEINNGSYREQLSDVYNTKDPVQMKAFISVENNFQCCRDMICDSDEYLRAFIPLISNENLASLLNDKKIRNFICANQNQYKGIILDIINANAKKELVQFMKKNTTVWKAASTNNIIQRHASADFIAKFKDVLDFHKYSKRFEARLAASIDPAAPLDVIKQHLSDYNKTSSNHLTYYKYKTYMLLYKTVHTALLSDSIELCDFVVLKLGSLQTGTLNNARKLPDISDFICYAFQLLYAYCGPNIAISTEQMKFDFDRIMNILEQSEKIRKLV